MFAGIALLLAVIGIYGVIAYSVVQRTREIGIRIGLGASCAVFAQMVLKHGLGLAIAGVILGLGAGMILTRTMATLLSEVQPGNLQTFATVDAFLVATALVACFLDSLRVTESALGV